MSLIVALQIVIVVSGLVSTVPQALRARRDATGVSLATWAGFIATSSVWMVYGISVGDPLQLVVNVPVIGLTLVVCHAAWPSAGTGERRRSVAFALIVLSISLTAAFALGTTAAALVAIAVTLVQLTPQVIEVLQTQNPTGVSVATWTILAGNQATWMAYGLLDGQPFLATNAAIMGSVGVLIAVLTTRRTTRARRHAVA